MLNERQLGFEDYLRILKKRWWIILIPAIVGPVAAYFGSLAIPSRYVSQTYVSVEHQRVPDTLVRPVLTDDLVQRVQSMKEQVLSRTRLQPIIERFGLYKKDVGKVPIEELIDRTRSRVVIDLTGRGVPGFYISFTADDPRVAQSVCAEITSMFMQENLRLREQHAEGTTEFLRSQLDEAKRKLDDQDARLATFKQRYAGQLPGQEQASMNMLMALNTQLEAATQALSRAQQDKSYNEAILAQQLTDWRAQENSESNPRAVEEQLARLQDALVAAEARYTADHPDVVKLRQEIAAVREKLREKPKVAESEPKPAATEPPQIKQSRLVIHQLNQSIRDRTTEQDRLQVEIRRYQARVQLSPIVEEQYKKLTRDYQTALGFYTDLLAKKTQAEMATDLEKKSQGEQFRVVDPPSLPEKPAYPNRRLFAAMGFLGGFGLGFGIVMLLEMRNRGIRNDSDISFYLELPTLAMVPNIDKAAKHMMRARNSSRK